MFNFGKMEDASMEMNRNTSCMWLQLSAVFSPKVNNYEERQALQLNEVFPAKLNARQPGRTLTGHSASV
jgi:hypothetical protein